MNNNEKVILHRSIAQNRKIKNFPTKFLKIKFFLTEVGRGARYSGVMYRSPRVNPELILRSSSNTVIRASKCLKN